VDNCISEYPEERILLVFWPVLGIISTKNRRQNTEVRKQKIEACPPEAGRYTSKMREIIEDGIGKFEYEYTVAVAPLVSSIGFRLRLKRRFTLNATDTSCTTNKRMTKLINLFYNCKESSTNRPFFAKQSQFSKKVKWM
jgi:hypothetical protein